MIAAIFTVLSLGLAGWLIVGMIGIVRMKSNDQINKIEVLPDAPRHYASPKQSRRHDLMIMDPQDPESSWQHYQRTAPNLPQYVREAGSAAEAMGIHDKMMAAARDTARKQRAAFDATPSKGQTEQRGRGGRQ